MKLGMKGKLGKIPTTLVLAASIFCLSSSFAAAADLGGWTEEGGYWKAPVTSLISTMSSSEPESHTAEIEYRDVGFLEARIIATTEWYNVYHYTRARWEGPFGGVYGDSGRVWGWDETTATSGWYDRNTVSARSYWGRE